MRTIHLLPVLIAALAPLGCSGSPINEPAPPAKHTSLPPAPAGPPPDGTEPVVFAVRTLYLGDHVRGGAPAPNAWKSFGLDIDGIVSDSHTTGLCTLQPGAPASTHDDGDDGIDNSFGKNLVPLLLTTAGDDAPARIQSAIDGGDFTILLRVDRLGSGATYAPLTGAVMGGASLGHAPAWNGLDAWPIDESTMMDGPASSPRLVFGAGYLTARTLVTSPPTGNGSLSLGKLHNLPLIVPLTHLQIMMQVSPDGASARGVLSAIIPAPTFALTLARALRDDSICDTRVDRFLLDAVVSAADILVDGTQDPNATCNGISIGLGFDAVPAALGNVVAPQTLTEACP